jgi:superfamily II DNA/RNA helicase
VFVKRPARGEALARLIERSGVRAGFVSGATPQKERFDAMRKMRDFELRVLVSTDLTSRGVDLERVNLVVHMDVPPDAATYAHRVGRAGRFGGNAVSVAIFTANELASLRAMLENTNHDLCELPEDRDAIPADWYAHDLDARDQEKAEALARAGAEAAAAAEAAEAEGTAEAEAFWEEEFCEEEFWEDGEREDSTWDEGSTAVSRVEVSGRATYRTRATPRTTTPLAAAGEKKGSRRKATPAPVSTATGRRGARGPRGGGGGGATSSRRRYRDPRGCLPSRSKRRRSAPAFLGSCRPCAKPRSSRGGERGARRRRNRAAPCADVWSCSLEIML